MFSLRKSSALLLSLEEEEAVCWKLNLYVECWGFVVGKWEKMRLLLLVMFCGVVMVVLMGNNKLEKKACYEVISVMWEFSMNRVDALMFWSLEYGTKGKNMFYFLFIF
jgi:hypothetical protein